jgi:large subunit ribosomal protein L3
VTQVSNPQPENTVALELLCRKLGMSRYYSDSGDSVPVTVLEAGPNVVIQKKTVERDGYTAVQLGFGERRASTLGKGQRGHFEKAGADTKRFLKECRVSAEELEGLEIGQVVTVEVFAPGQKVDAVGTSRGRGTAGTVKRHNFKVKRRTHGTHEAFRHGGSIGAGAYPGKVFKGMGMFGRYGAEQVTVRNLEVVAVEADRNLLIVRGAIPGHPNALVRLRPAVAAH